MDALSDVRRDVAEYVGPSGACPGDEEVLTAINDARRIIYPVGEWKDTVVPLQINVYGGCFTLPPAYDHIKKLFAGRAIVDVKNDWFSVLNDGSKFCGTAVAATKVPGEFVTFREWNKVAKVKGCCLTTGFYLRVICEDDRDEGVELTFQAVGIHEHQVSLTRTLLKAWQCSDAQPGEAQVLRLTYVVKPKTFGRIRVYGYDDTSSVLMAIYDSGDVNPQFSRYTFPCHGQHIGVIGKAKKRYKPLVNETDPVDIHTNALIHCLQAITARKSRDLGMFNSSMQQAISFLMAEIASPQGSTTTPMQMSSAYRMTGLVE
jgi:hypothetical protein